MGALLACARRRGQRRRATSLAILGAIAWLPSCARGCAREWRTIDDGVLSEDVRGVEPALAFGASGAVAAAWMEAPDPETKKPTNIAARLGRSAGREWGSVTRIPSDGRAMSDPSLAPTPEGGFALAWLAFEPDVVPRHVGVYVAESHAGASTFAPRIVQVSDDDRGAIADRPALARTRDGVLLTYAFARGTRTGIAAARRERSGAWRREVVLEREGITGILAAPCASTSSARVWIASYEPGFGLLVRASEDGGATFGEAIIVDPDPAADAPSCAGDADALVVVYGKTSDAASSGASPKLRAVVVASSRDGGRTFATRELAPGAGEHAAAVVMHARVARETSGTVDVAYYVADRGDPRGRFVLARASSAEGSFGAPISLGDAWVVPARASREWSGDYAGLASDGASVYAAFVDAHTPPRVVFAAGRAPVQ